MKNITPIQYTSEPVMAEVLKVVIIEDNLSSFARFGWWLFTAEMNFVDTGISRCEEDDYLAWDGSNTYPYTFVAKAIGVEIIGSIY